MMAPLRENPLQPPPHPSSPTKTHHPGHAKSVSPQKEVIWRRSTSIAPSNNGYRSDTATSHPFRHANRRSMLASMNHIPQPMPPPSSRRPFTMMEPSFDPYADYHDAASLRRMQYQQRRQMSALQLSLAEQAQEMDREQRFGYSRSNGAGPTNNPTTTGTSPTATAPGTFSTAPAPSSPLSQSSSTSSSYYDAPHAPNQHPNLIRMHSNDSLYQSSEAGGYAPSPPRSTAAGPGPQYPQHGGNPGSAMHSPLMARREVAPPQPLQYAPPPQPQMLVDPNTGQQYYFPSAPQPLYYPMVPAPMYYAPAQVPPGYVMPHHPHQPQPPQSPTHARAMYYRPQPSYGANYPQPGQHGHPPPTSSGYFVEHPPSSNVSVCEPEYFSRSHASRHSMESGSSGSIKEDFRSGAGSGARDRDSMSASPKPVTSFAEIPSSSQHSQQSSQYGSSNNTHAPIGGKFSTTSSCTSGFASGAGESTADTMFNSSFASTKNRPAWWGTTETTTRIGLDDVKQTPSPVRSSPEDRTPTLSHQSSIGASQPAAEVDRSSPASEPTTLPSKAPVAKAIRMDIDLSAPITPVESPKPKPRPATASTAFTVTFDPPAAAKKPVSLQDAANGRRFAARRSLPSKTAKPAAAAEVESESETQDPKHYLFNKMIQGLRKPPEKTQPISETVSTNKKPDIDTLSEAGTYIVESRRKPETDNNDADNDSDDDSSRFEDDSDDTESTVSPTEASVSAPPTQRQPAPRLPPPKQSLLTARLQQLNLRNTRNSSTPAAAPAPSAPTPAARSIRPCQRPSTTATSGPSANNNFRNHKCRCQSETRGDGGRFSMRSGPSAIPFNPPSTRNSTGSNTAAARPPFKSGPAAPPRRSNAAMAVGTPGPSKETPEMAAWLRRKEYDPRKSAAEARKIQALKARLLHLTTGGHTTVSSSSSSMRPGTAPQHDDPSTDETSYLSNRSMSFHPDGGNSGFPSVSSRNNKSHDDLSHVGEDDESFSGVENKKTNAELERKVDEINEKCLRSIQMIKLYSQNTISDSVENLLERVVQPDGQESVTDQLSRLGSAFEAIQKYFEERSGSVSPPASARRGAAAGAVADSPRPRTVSTDPSIRDSASSASSAAGSRHLRLL